MVAANESTLGKTPRQQLRSLAMDLLRRVENHREDMAEAAEAVRQHAAIIVAECEREQGQEVTR